MIEEKLRVCESELKQLQNRRLELIALKYRLKNEIKMENTVSTCYRLSCWPAIAL